MGTAIMLLICIAGFLFMIRFFIALCQEKKAGWRCWMISVRPQSADDAQPELNGLRVIPGGKEIVPRRRDNEVIVRRDVQPVVLEMPVDDEEEHVARVH